MDRKKLCANILMASSDEEKKKIILSIGNKKLYRFRPYNGTADTEKEMNTLKQQKIWASRMDCFDDDYEGTIINAKSSDIDIVLKVLENIDEKRLAHEFEYGVSGQIVRRNTGIKSEKVFREQIALLRRGSFGWREKNKIALLFIKKFDQCMREYRLSYRASCFTENRPNEAVDMWKQYAVNKDGSIAGFCLEYDLYDIVKSGYIICPVYYENNTTITDIYLAFGNKVQGMFLHKNEFGYDSKKEPDCKKAISWMEQKEWRIIEENNSTEKGKHLDRVVIPSCLYYLDGTPCIEKIIDVAKELGITCVCCKR